MPSDPAPVTVTVRPPDQAPYVLTLERLTDHIRAARLLRMTVRDDLKAKRLKAMSVVPAQLRASSDMYDRVIARGEEVTTLRQAVESAHVNVLQEQHADLTEMGQELLEFAQAVPTSVGAQPAPPPQPASLAAVKTALDDLLSTAPNPSKEGWEKGDAYAGTHPA